MFFRPRIGQHYQEGFKGYRTLVLGVKHHCTLRHCRYFADCVLNKNCKRYDSLCLAYDCANYVNGRKMCETCITINGEHCKYYEPRTMEEKCESFLLSQSNIIEINAFLEENDHYPAYTYFTKLLLNKSDDFSDDEKTDFWEHVAFTNYLQYFCETPQVPSYENNGMAYRQEDWEAFKELMEELQPEVVFVWNLALKTLLDKKISEGELQDLTYFDDFRSETLTVNRYLFKVQPKKTPNELFADFHLAFCPDGDEAIAAQLMLNALQKARFRQFVPSVDLKLTPEMVEAAQPNIWDRELMRFLIGKRPTKLELDKLVSTFESEIKELVQNCHCVSSFPLDVADTKAIDAGGELSELSWFDLCKTASLDDTNAAILYVTDANDTLKKCLKALVDKKLNRVGIIMNVKDSDKLLVEVVGCPNLRSIVEKEQALLVQFDDKPHDRVCLKYGGKTKYPRPSFLERSMSLRPFHYLSSEEIPDFEKMVKNIFGTEDKKLDKIKEQRGYLYLLLKEWWKEGYIRRGSRDRLKAKVPQLLFYGLHKSGVEYEDLEKLFDHNNMRKNANEAKINKILTRNSPVVSYYKKLFKL